MRSLFLAIWFLVFCSVSFASPVGNNIGKPSNTEKITNSANKTALCLSNPSSNLKKPRSNTLSSEDIPPAKISKCSSKEDEVAIDEVYQNQVDISQSFLDPEKRQRFLKRHFGQFECDYQTNKKKANI